MKSQTQKRIESFIWAFFTMAIPAGAAFLVDPTTKEIIEKYPAELGFLVTLGLILAQITKAVNSYLSFKKEMAKFK